VALFNEILAARYNRALTKLLGMVGSGAPAPQLEAAIRAVLVLEGDRPELGFLKGERRWSSGPLFVAGAGGNFGRAQIKNPTGSGLIVTVVGFANVFGAVNSQSDISTDGAEIVAGVSQNTATDLRVPLNVGVTARPVGSQNAVDNSLVATSGIIIDRIATTGGVAAGQGEAAMHVGPVVLVPGTRVELTQRTAALSLFAVAWGYERLAEPGELQV
jgi:hypothetical protein